MINELEGKQITLIMVSPDNGRIDFTCDDGSQYAMLHHQDCCESVHIEDIVGDLSDLVGSTILKAEEVTSHKHPVGKEDVSTDESFTWTFYHLATIKGYVTIRWLGTSNGYYSESVDFFKIQ